jgi:Helix-turn-helix domain
MPGATPALALGVRRWLASENTHLLRSSDAGSCIDGPVRAARKASKGWTQYTLVVGEDLSHGNIAATGHEVPTPSGWVSTQQTARALGISPRTVRWHIEQGNLEANLEGRRVKRTWLVSIDSLQAFREARRVAALLPETLRTPADESEMALSIPVGG